MVEIKDLTMRFGKQLLFENVNLSLDKGRRYGLIGANGAGKSTLLSFMARLKPLISGSISYNGRDLAGTPTAQVAKMLAILTQENSIHSRIAVRDLLLFGRYPYHQGQPTAEDQAIVDNALAEFQLQELAHRYLTELSGGQRQRALIAMVFCQSTEYVLLDEPLNNLDMYYARNLMQLLHRLAHSQQRTIIVVLHDINMAAAYADHVVAMKQGQVLFSGCPDEVFTVPNIQAAFNMTVDVLDYKGKKLIVHHF